jgi:phosphoribosylformylglycinamidine synthase
VRRWLPHLGIVVGVCIAVYALFFASNDEDEIRALLERLETAVAVRGQSNPVVRMAQINKEFKEIFIKEVSFQIPELTSKGAGRRDLAKLAAAAPRLYSSAEVDLDGLAIDVDDQGLSAVAQGEATLSGIKGGQPSRDTREVALRLDKIDGDWRIVSAYASRKLD